MIDNIAFAIMQILALITASILTVIARYINDPDRNLQIESMAMSNWFLVYSNLDELPPEIRYQVLSTGKIILVFLVFVFVKNIIGAL